LAARFDAGQSILVAADREWFLGLMQLNVIKIRARIVISGVPQQQGGELERTSQTAGFGG
jgi:hypothetical protein